MSVFGHASALGLPNILIQPALDVMFFFQEGDMLYLGTAGSVLIEIKDRQGEMFDPTDDIVVTVWPVDSSNQIGAAPLVAGTAAQELLENEPQPGRYVFVFDTAPFAAVIPVPASALVRASIPFGSTEVVWQRTVQFQPLDQLS
jgi:hypothetical protein